MKSLSINLKMAGDVKDFVNIVSQFNYDIDLRTGRYVVDAKSILGIFSLDLSKPIIMEVHSDSCEDLITALKKFL